jgi:hypothetical protein
MTMKKRLIHRRMLYKVTVRVAIIYIEYKKKILNFAKSDFVQTFKSQFLDVSRQSSMNKKKRTIFLGLRRKRTTIQCKKRLKKTFWKEIAR